MHPKREKITWPHEGWVLVAALPAYIRKKWIFYKLQVINNFVFSEIWQDFTGFHGLCWISSDFHYSCLPIIVFENNSKLSSPQKGNPYQNMPFLSPPISMSCFDHERGSQARSHPDTQEISQSSFLIKTWYLHDLLANSCSDDTSITFSSFGILKDFLMWLCKIRQSDWLIYW